MSTNYGIKISKEGAEATSNDPRDLLMSSKYLMLKYHDTQTGSLTFTPGDTEQYSDITHSLGYVPAFIAYMQDLNDTSKLMFMMGPPPTDFGVAPWSYADSTKIRVGLATIGFAYNKYLESFSDLWDDHFGVNTHIVIGKKDGNTRAGAMRFTNVAIPQGSTLISATINFGVEFKGAGSTNLKAKIYGIAEDNTASYSSNPMGRTKTTAFTSPQISLPATGAFGNMDVTAPMQEIINRGGWSSGNALGFLVFDNGSDDTVWMEDDVTTGIQSTLTVTYGGNTTVNFRVIIFKDKIA